MNVQRATIADNVSAVRQRIAEAALRVGRDPAAVHIVAVTKTVGIEEARALVDLGIYDLGENRVDVAQSKIEQCERPVRWHMIGSVQRRRARAVVELFDAVDSVDRISLAEALSRFCVEQDKSLPVLIEVNVSREESKHGFKPDEVPEAVVAVRGLPGLVVEGLMTMAPLVDDPEETRPLFARLCELAHDVGVKELSMGMTNDFEVAVEEGATQVRIGTAFFV
jgi:PLP dependent protein